MSTFEIELRTLVTEWIRRGDSILSMYDALKAEAERLGEKEWADLIRGDQ